MNWIRKNCIFAPLLILAVTFAAAQDAETAYRRGVELAKSGTETEAEMASRNAIAMDASHRGAHLTLLRMSLQRKDYASAVTELQFLLSHLDAAGNDDITGQWMLLAQCQAELAHWPQADAAAAQAVALSAEPLAALRLRVKILLNAGNHAQAAQLAQSALLQFPTEKLFWRTLEFDAQTRGDEIAARQARECATRLCGE